MVDVDPGFITNILYSFILITFILLFYSNSWKSVEISYEKKVIPKYDLDILYEDEYLIAINKPSGLLSIESDSEKNNTMLHTLFFIVPPNQMSSVICFSCASSSLRIAPAVGMFLLR